MRAPSKVLGAAEDARKTDKKIGKAVKAATLANKANKAKKDAEQCANEKGGVYTLQDKKGKVMKTGRSNDLPRRKTELARDPK